MIPEELLKEEILAEARHNLAQAVLLVTPHLENKDYAEVFDILLDRQIEKRASHSLVMKKSRKKYRKRDRDNLRKWRERNPDHDSSKAKKEHYIKNKAILLRLLIFDCCQLSCATGSLEWAHIKGNGIHGRGVENLLSLSSVRPALEEALNCARLLEEFHKRYDQGWSVSNNPEQNLDSLCEFAESEGYSGEELRQRVLAFHQRVRDYLEENPNC